MKKQSVYAYGMISASTLVRLSAPYPKPDAYAEMREIFHSVGGEAGNSAIVLAKLGVGVKLDGNWLGNDAKGIKTSEVYKRFGVDIGRLRLVDDYYGAEEIVIADETSRTVFGTYCRLLFTEKQWNIPEKADVENAKAVCLDPFFGNESLWISRTCREFGKPCVSIDCKYENEIVANSSVMIISEEFRNREYPGVDKERLISAYVDSTDGLVIFTSGSSAVLYGRNSGEIKSCLPPKIQPIDTTGAGDSFRSGVIYGILQNWPETKTIKFACALAAEVCLSVPGVLNCPGCDQVIEFMETYSC